MRFSFGNKIWLTSLLVVILGTGLVFLGRRPIYYLNRNVRLVCMRIFEYEELSRHRRQRYKMEFARDHYDIYLLVSSPQREWKEIRAILYEDAIETDMDGFALEIDRGRIASYIWPGGGRIIRSSLVLRFFGPAGRARQSGILFHRDGTWRALERFRSGG
jgi:hypothetical protein